MDEGSLDYSVDWNNFSFATELSTRKNILEEDLKAYNVLLNQLTPDNSTYIGESVIPEMENNNKLCIELLTANNDVFSKYKSLTEEFKQIKEEFGKLQAKNESLKEEIQKLKEEKSASINAYGEMKSALQIAYETYTANFNIGISTKCLSDTTYEALLHFNEKKDAKIKIIVDRKNRSVVDIHFNEALSPTDEEQIKSKFGNLNNLPGLLCALRDIILNT